MKQALLLFTLVSFICVCYSQGPCAPLTGPTCLIYDLGGTPPSSTFSAAFWTGLANTAPGGVAASTINIDIHNIPGSNLADSCGLVILQDAIAASPYQFQPADIAELQNYYDVGGALILFCERASALPNCPAMMNPLIPALDPSVYVRFQDPPVDGPSLDCLNSEPFGTSASFLFNVNDLTSGYQFYFNSAEYLTIPASDPACIFGSHASLDCVFAESNQMLFFNDVSPFSQLICDMDDQEFQAMGENVGGFIRTAASLATCGGAGGDPHIFTFDGAEVELWFENEKNYLLYASPYIRVVIHTSGSPKGSYITSIGVSFNSHQLLATQENLDPVFYFDDQPLTESISSSLGTIELFDPAEAALPGALGMLSRYLVIGLRVGKYLEIVGGIRPATGVFFNVELMHSHHNEAFGLLQEARNNIARDANFVAQFETPSLFD